VRILAFAIPILLFTIGCNAQSKPDSSNEASTEESTSKTSKRADPKWMITIEGMPERSGRQITAITAGGYGNYAMARDGFTASIKLDQDDPASTMMFGYDEENVRCVNKDGATASRDGDRAIIEGEVLCYPDGGSFDDAKPAAIEGYFEINQ